MLLADQILRYL